MRELKFRAWFNRFNKMVYEVDKDTFDLWKGYWNGKIHIVYPDDGDVVEQYTGLKDKNGKEIYEGDIVEYIWDFCGEKRKNNYVVEWLSGKVEYYPCSVDAGFTLPDSVEEYYVVIGNIHENPELVEEK